MNAAEKLKELLGLGEDVAVQPRPVGCCRAILVEDPVDLHMAVVRLGGRRQCIACLEPGARATLVSLGAPDVAGCPHCQGGES